MYYLRKNVNFLTACRDRLSFFLTRIVSLDQTQFFCLLGLETSLSAYKFLSILLHA
jgi:hypothetical protein